MVILKVVRNDLNRMRDFCVDISNLKWLNNDRENERKFEFVGLLCSFIWNHKMNRTQFQNMHRSIMNNRDAYTMARIEPLSSVQPKTQLRLGEIILCIHNYNWMVSFSLFCIDTLKCGQDSMKYYCWWSQYGKQIKCSDTDYSRFHLNHTKKCCQTTNSR